MENMPPIPPPFEKRSALQSKPSTSIQSTQHPTIGWEVVEAATGSSIPCQRSLHAGAVWRDQFLVFGGYDGLHRVNDLYSFDFKTSMWRALSNADAPSPRDRHVAVVYLNSLYIFGGFDGVARVNGKRLMTSS